MSADKKRIRVDGQFVEVTNEVYKAYIKGDRKERYMEVDLKTERILLKKDGTIRRIVPSREDSLDRLMEDNCQQFAEEGESVEETVFRHIFNEALYQVLGKLSKKERWIIYQLYYERQTERDIGKQLGISHQAVHNQKMKILQKLKFFLEQ